MTREYTNKLLDMVDEGLFDLEDLVRDLACWMSEADVKEFMLRNDYLDDEDE